MNGDNYRNIFGVAGPVCGQWPGDLKSRATDGCDKELARMLVALSILPAPSLATEAQT